MPGLGEWHSWSILCVQPTAGLFTWIPVPIDIRPAVAVPVSELSALVTPATNHETWQSRFRPIPASLLTSAYVPSSCSSPRASAALVTPANLYIFIHCFIFMLVTLVWHYSNWTIFDWIMTVMMNLVTVWYYVCFILCQLWMIPCITLC